MAQMQFVSKSNLSYIWGKIKAYIADALGKKIDAPTGGTTGQVLTKTDDGAAWQDTKEPDALTSDEIDAILKSSGLAS